MKIKRGNLFVMRSNLVNCTFEGRRTALKILNNIEIIDEILVKLDKEFISSNPHFNNDIAISKIGMINNLIVSSKPKDEQVKQSTIADIAKKYPEEFKLFTDHKDAINSFNEKEIEIKFNILKKREIPKNVSVKDLMNYSFVIFND